jgi:hypothetical protein
MINKTWTLWGAALATTAGLSLYFGVRLTSADKLLFSPGEMTSGHYQIEVACDVCHTPFSGVKQDACLACHGAELEAANDSHPKKKFDDPRNADRLKTLDARWCVTCHVEHRPERTRAMGVTQPDDYCFHCHADIGRERRSHEGLIFASCASAGCHNYHDNSALYEDFLAKHADEPATWPAPRTPMRDLAPLIRAAGLVADGALRAIDQNAPADRAEARAVNEWAAAAHARSGVNCRDCHEDKHGGGWIERPARAQCAVCHDAEAAGFLDGKHGMRLKQGLSAMSPALARQPMRADAHDKELGCNSCHAAHRDDTRTAAVESCLGCHDDPHSRAYRASPHARLWEEEIRGVAAPGSGVSCATCHLPREIHKSADTRSIRVQHNQNLNLRPNEKMIRGVCMNCHGVAYAIDALADPALIQSNFAAPATRHIDSVDMAAVREKAEAEKKSQSPTNHSRGGK